MMSAAAMATQWVSNVSLWHGLWLHAEHLVTGSVVIRAGLGCKVLHCLLVCSVSSVSVSVAVPGWVPGALGASPVSVPGVFGICFGVGTGYLPFVIVSRVDVHGCFWNLPCSSISVCMGYCPCVIALCAS